VVHSLQLIILAIIMNIHVLITTSADSVTLAFYVMRFLVKPAICTVDTTTQEQDGKCTFSFLCT